MIQQSTEISNRCDFSLLCNARGIRHAVEVGVELGKFAREFLSRWDGIDYVLVDDYASHPEHPGDRTCDRIMACQAVMPWHNKLHWLCVPSKQAAVLFPSARFPYRPGFVYIDASHDYDSVCGDMLDWWSCLAEGGILAGHDFDDGHQGVKLAVEWFARQANRVVRLTQETLPSWYIYRDEPEKLVHRYWREGESDNAGR